VTGVIVRAIPWCARAAGAGDNPLDLLRVGHSSVIANVNLITGPVKVNGCDMRLGTQCLLDRLSTLNAVHIVQCERCVLYTVSRVMSHTGSSLLIHYDKKVISA
jgi:hypothetical protein